MRLKLAIQPLGFVLLAVVGSPCLSATDRLFAPDDDVGIALFEYAGRGAQGGVIKYSPDGRYFAVVTERGRLDLNGPEDTIWVFSTEKVRRFLRQPRSEESPTAMPLAQLTTDRDGPLIDHVRWIPDSSGVAFTAVKKSQQCKFRQLLFASVQTQTLKALTPEDQDIAEFDVRNGANYVYEVRAPEQLSAPHEEQPLATALTGKTLWEIVFPNLQRRVTPFNAAGLWAVIEGNRRQVLDAKSYETSRTSAGLALSPDGRLVVAMLKTEHAPEMTWARYKAPPGYDKLKLPLDTSAYHLIDLIRGTKRLLVNAPSGVNQDWHSYFLRASWSADGTSLLLPDTFFPLDVTDPKEIADRESHPYIAVLRLQDGELSKVVAVRAGLDKERYAVKEARFQDHKTVVVDFDRSYFLPDRAPAAVFRRRADGRWQLLPTTEDPRLAKLPIRVRESESMNQPPMLVAEDRAGRTSRAIWDPNPQLKGIELGSTEVVRWKDGTGHDWEAGLLKPPRYVAGQRYPLVIQTHGFIKTQFLSNGIFTSVFAAGSLAAHGIAVLQMPWNPTDFDTEKEGPDQVAGFRSVIKKLDDDGVIDPTKVGAIGFSRSVYHVLYAMTAHEPQLLAAASVTDGVTFGYFEYISAVDGGLDREADKINGSKPFGAEGLNNWLTHSPEFQLDQARTPLLLLQPGPASVFADWEPYAVLRYLKKPVDLIMLQSGTHVMTNPTQRLAAETANVDWFRFWLQGYEDPSEAKVEQYRRWEKLCDMQVEQNPNRPAFCTRIKAH